MPKYITRKGHAFWSARLDEIRKELRKVYDEIHEAAKMGDLRENAEYQFACERRDRLGQERDRISERMGEVRAYIEDIKQEKDVVGVGSYVKFVRDDTEEEFEYCILGDKEDENPRPNVKIIIYEAPIARQVLGRKVGDFFTLQLPAWESEVEILEVEPLFPEGSRAEEQSA